MMSSFVEDKCFICYHIDFSSHLNECLHSLFQHCTSIHVVSLYIPPGFTKQTHKKKKIVIIALRLAPSL